MDKERKSLDFKSIFPTEVYLLASYLFIYKLRFSFFLDNDGFFESFKDFILSHMNLTKLNPLSNFLTFQIKWKKLNLFYLINYKKQFQHCKIKFNLFQKQLVKKSYKFWLKKATSLPRVHTKKILDLKLLKDFKF